MMHTDAEQVSKPPLLFCRSLLGVLLLLLLLFVLAACSFGTGNNGSVSSTDAMQSSSSSDAGSLSEVGPPTVLSSISVLDNAVISSKPGTPSYQHVAGNVVLSAPKNAKVTLVLDLKSSCFPFADWETPPPGQNWPASCDAFDRNFEVFLVDPANPNPNAAKMELVHAITPFGGPLHIEQDVTDIFNSIGTAPRSLEVFIPSFSDAMGLVSGSAGQWTISARLDVESGPAPRNVLAVIPLKYGKSTELEQTFTFDTPAGTTSGRIEYIATGHGSGAASPPDCIGQAEEFCRRKHELLLDGSVADIMTLDPWRTNCATLCTLVEGGPGGRRYCKENPCGAISSVRAPRANWCPGSVTQPFVFEPSALTTAGTHSLTIKINKIADRGNWRMSAKVFLYGP